MARARARARAEADWRFKYGKHVVKNVELCLKSPEACLTIARTGLAEAPKHFEFSRGGTVMPLSEAMAAYKGTLASTTITGSGTLAPALRVPYKGAVLSGKVCVLLV